MDRATPNLPSRDLIATSRFYAHLGFHEKFRDEGWLILVRGTLQLEFFPRTELNPRTNFASCYIRVSDARLLPQAFAAAGLPTARASIPRLTAPVDQPWGLCEFALIDPDGNLLRCLSEITREAERNE